MKEISDENFDKNFSSELIAEAKRRAANGEKIKLKSDIGFKLFFSKNTPESNYCLRKLIGALTNQQVTEATVLNTELLPEFYYAKKCRLDVNVTFNNGQKADIELQLRCEGDEERKRAIYYTSKLYASSLEEGKDYEAIPNVYQIFINDFTVFNDTYFIRTFKLKDEYDDILSESMQIIFCELPKLKKLISKNSDCLSEAEFWCTLISVYDNHKTREKLYSLSEFKEEIVMADRTSQQVSHDYKDWCMRLSIEGGEHDYIAAMNHYKRLGLEEGRKEGLELGIEEGIKEGIKEGVKKGIEKGLEKGLEEGIEKGAQKKALEMAQKLILRNNMSLEEIAELTEISIDEIKKIAKNTGN